MKKILTPTLLLPVVFAFMLISCGSGGDNELLVSTSEYSGFTYPQGKFKAVVLSFDDGLEQDRQLLELFNRYEVKGTFNLNSGLLGSTAEWRLNQESYIESNEVAQLYSGHELSSHSRYHAYLTRLTAEQINETISVDQNVLQDLSGYPIKSLAYPFGVTDDNVISVLTELGITNARTVDETENFELPLDRMRWGPTCHYRNANNFVARYQSLSSRELSVFYIWGHSWELDDGANDWEQMELFAQQISQDENIWFTTAGELSDYLVALEAVQISDGMLHNPIANSTVWIDSDGEIEAVQPGDTVTIDRVE